MARRIIERRMVTDEIEVRQTGGTVTIEGHAAVFNDPTDMGFFTEVVEPGAFTKTLKEADVRALINHDPNYVLGRNIAGTMDLSEDRTGLLYRIMPPDTTYARDLMISMERRDISQSSFAFRSIVEDFIITNEGQADEQVLRKLQELALVDVSVVTYPAYENADAGVVFGDRAVALLGVSKRSGIDVNDLMTRERLIEVVRGFALPTTEPGETTSEPDDLQTSTSEPDDSTRAEAVKALEERVTDFDDFYAERVGR